jgi:hypothetical protein
VFACDCQVAKSSANVSRHLRLYAPGTETYCRDRCVVGDEYKHDAPASESVSRYNRAIRLTCWRCVLVLKPLLTCCVVLAIKAIHHRN